jgi:hypothetical protein
MSYARMGETEQRLKAEIDALLKQAEDVDAAEDAQYGKGRRDDAVEALLDGELSPPEDVHLFHVDGLEVCLKEDRSGIWEGGASSHDEAIQILGSFFRRLDELAGNDATQDRAIEIIGFVMENNQRAVVWRRLLSLLAKYPKLAEQFKGLADAEPLMFASETSRQFGDFIHTLYPLLSAEERVAFEGSILAIAEAGEADQRQAWQRRSDELLSALGDVGLVTEAAQSRLTSIKAAAAVNAQRPPASLGFGQMPPDDIERMHRQGGNGRRAHRSEAHRADYPAGRTVWRRAHQQCAFARRGGGTQGNRI